MELALELVLYPACALLLQHSRSHRCFVRRLSWALPLPSPLIHRSAWEAKASVGSIACTFSCSGHIPSSQSRKGRTMPGFLKLFNSLVSPNTSQVIIAVPAVCLVKPHFPLGLNACHHRCCHGTCACGALY